MFHPQRILFETRTLDFPMGKQIYDLFSKKEDVELIQCSPNKVKELITLDSTSATYQSGKRTLVLSKKKRSAFQTCKPSADYMLPLVSGCMGQCEYCYLHTKLGDKPFVRVHVNIDDILDRAKEYITASPDKITSFEGSATSDPVCVEPFTHSLATAIDFFAKEPQGRFRFVTKYDDVDSLLHLQHNNKTEIRFSINTEHIRSSYEHYTATVKARILAAQKVMDAGYPTGFLIAPVFLYDGWREEYFELIQNLRQTLPANPPHPVTFEVITHRFTPKAKELIGEIFPDSTLPMNEDERVYKRGQFGYGKFTYAKDDMRNVKEFFKQELGSAFPNGNINYIV